MTNAKIEKNLIYISINNNWEEYATFQEKNRNHRITIVQKINNDTEFFAKIKQIHIKNKNWKLTAIRPFEL